ncbi:tetratricopeptide repeat protein [Paenalcaligenes niemegkensis]|uniref:tetratricopeptide repeat protein n=1 Tax=Paenalcaligenes niemegkensis TaxID=2895469 RepID=UPI001EE7AC85|nr:tetratricopeptide repeat protein [Paenalcaligenes niemegkensis]MCQ9616986.1 tetratricopeptide repeat protein [Paenalcaligenes niemegkensis]
MRLAKWHQRVTVKRLSVVALLALAGCSGSGMESAYQLIEQQQSQQALIRKHEADEWKKNAPNQREIALNTISEVQQQGRYFASLAFIDAYVSEFGRNAEIDVMQAEALRSTGQFEESQALYESLVAGSEAALAHRGLGLLAGQQQNYPQAARHLSKAVQLRPTDARLLSDLGFAQLRSHQLAQARVSLGKAAELDPENAKVLSNLALYLLVDGQEQRAQAVMAQLKISDGVRDAIYELAHDIQRDVALASQPVAVSGGAVSVVNQSSHESAAAPHRVGSAEDVAGPAAAAEAKRVVSAVSQSNPEPIWEQSNQAEIPFGFTNPRLIQ